MHCVFRQAVRFEAPTRSETWLWRCVVLLFALLALFAPTGARGGPDELVGDETVPDLEQTEQAFQRVVARVSPSVVGIRVQRRYMATLGDADAAVPPGIFQQLVTVNGSGTIIDPDGLILTNEHVVQSASEIEVSFCDGQVLPATVVAADARGDLAVLKVARENLSAARFVDWPRVARGQWTVTLGNPYGLGADGQSSVSVGVISNLHRRLPGLGEVDDRFYADMIQTTAAIHPGCSGGPLFNIHGELVGVVTAMHTRAPADEGVGFAIPMTPARLRLIQQLAAGEPVAYGYLGLTVREPQPEEREAAGLDPQFGAVVAQVDPAGPAGEVGVRPGDLILRFEDQAVCGPCALAELVGYAPPGQRVTVELWRTPQRLAVQPVVQRREVNSVSWMRGGALLWRGMRLTDLDPDRRRRMGMDPTALGVVVIDVMQGSAAQRAAIQVGDVIEQVAQACVHDASAFRAEVRGQNGPVKIRVHARGEFVVPP
jgi:serine protease Do